MRRCLFFAIMLLLWLTGPIGLERGAAQSPVAPPNEPAVPSRKPVSPEARPILIPNAAAPAQTNPTPVSDRPSPFPIKDNDPSARPVSAAPPAVQPQGNVIPGSTAPASPITQTAPVVSVEMIGPEAASVAHPIAYEIIVKNHGQVAVANVKVEDELPAGFRYIGGEPKAEFPGPHMNWNIGILDAGAERHIKIVVQANAEGELRSKATVSFSTSCGIVTRFTRPKLAVGVTGPESALVGEQVAFQIRVANVGSGPIQRVMLRDRLPAGLQHPNGNQIEADIGGLGPGEEKMITLRATAVKTGQLVNEVFAVADNGPSPNGIQLTGGSRNPDLEAAAKAQVKVVEPGLQVRVSGPKTCLVKCEGLFSIDMTNPGSAASHNVQLVANLPEGVDFVAASDDGVFDLAARTVRWGFVSQDPGAHRVLTIKTRGCSLAESTMLVVTGQADGNLSAKAELPVRVDGIPAISLEVVDPDDPSPVDTDFTYEIRVMNQGSCPCTGIQITAQMPEGMELREAQAPAPYKVVGQQIQFAPFARLATKGDAIYRVKVRCSRPGDVRFRVQLTCDQLQQPVLKEESSRFYKP